MKQYITALACALIYFTAAFLTLSDYGISWDETIHFRRGQAYLNYFLTGNLNYGNLPTVNLQGTNGDPLKLTFKRSLYQNDFHNGEYFIRNDSGHPPLNGELAALTNYIFFQKLGILDDIPSHHLFNIFAASVLVFVVVSLALEYFGFFAAVISYVALITYPLFWGESHFNIKDPPEAAFFAATIWAFLKSLQKGSSGWIITTFVFFALAIGTKFNILFIPVILFPYILVRYKKYLPGLVVGIVKKYSLVILSGVVIALIIFIGSWPYLWQNWPVNLLNIFEFYRGIGTGTSYQPSTFFFFGFNMFPLLWVLFTTPPLTLALFSAGLAAIVLSKGEKNRIGTLLILWFLVPLLRVTVPGSSVYGGIRQVMEFLPALALLAGLGAWQIKKWLEGKGFFNNAVPAILVLLFIWPVVVLFKMHPNENLYFNFLIGGLPGAEVRNFPSWGNSFGNAYLQGISWINQNAESGSKVVLLQGTLANAPLVYFRSDIKYLPDEGSDKKNYFSGIERAGEYIMELTYNDSGKDFFHRWEYVEKFLDPVYELKVNGVAVLKIWKNDLGHTKTGMKLIPVIIQGPVKLSADRQFLYIDLEKDALLSGVELKFESGTGCIPLRTAFMETSLNRVDWGKEGDAIPQNQLYGVSNLQEDKISYQFAGRSAKHIRIAADSNGSCILNNPKVIITSLERE